MNFHPYKRQTYSASQPAKGSRHWQQWLNNVVATAIVVLMLIAIAACGDTGEGSGASSKNSANQTVFSASNSAGGTGNNLTTQAQQPLIRQGRFTLKFAEDGNVFNLPAVNETRARQIQRQLQPSLDTVNDLVEIGPEDVDITVTRCNLVNALYIAASRDIILCTELLDASYSALLNLNDQDTTLAANLAGQVFTFFMFHEIAHALDHLLDLPIFGNTESAADAIATVLAAETDSPEMVLYAAYLFTLSGDGSFGDVHYAGQDRAGDLVCWLFGSDPQLLEVQSLSELGQQFVDAGRDCTGEYEDQRAAVERWIPGLGLPRESSATPNSPASALLLYESNTSGTSSPDRNRATINNVASQLSDLLL